MPNEFKKNERGFTGLEAAIVLIAFVVVAAVFSYVMLGAGFFTTQKSQEVVHTGVTQASSSVELSGDVIAKADDPADPQKINITTLCLGLTSGGSSVDMAKTLIVVSAPDVPPTELKLGSTANATFFNIPNKYNNVGTTDDILDRNEKFEIGIAMDPVCGANDIEENDEFQIEVKPPQGASYTIHRKAPPAIKPIMTLY